MGLSPAREGSTVKRREEIIDGPIASALLIFPPPLPTGAGRVGPRGKKILPSQNLPSGGK